MTHLYEVLWLCWS